MSTSAMDDSDPMVESDPMAELAKQNAKYVKNCTELHLADRRIQRLAGFDPFVNLEVLWLNNNRLTKLEELDTNVRLRELYAHNNLLHTLRGSLHKFKFLNVLNVSNNKLHGLQATLDLLTGFQYLHHLELFGNPLAEETNYRLHVLKRISWLEVFDRHPVTEEELEAGKWLGTAKEKKEDMLAEPKPFVPEFSGTVKIALREVEMIHAAEERAKEAQRLALCQGVAGDEVDAAADPPCAYSHAVVPSPGGSQLTPWEWSHFLSLCKSQAANDKAGSTNDSNEGGMDGDGDAEAVGSSARGGAMVTLQHVIAAIEEMRYFGRCLDGGGTHDGPLGPQQHIVEEIFAALTEAAQAAQPETDIAGGKGKGKSKSKSAAVPEAAVESAPPPRINSVDFWRVASGHGFAAPEPGTTTGVVPNVLRWSCLADDEMEDLVHDLFEEAKRLQTGAMELETDDPRFKERQLRAADAAQKANRLSKQLEERVGEQKQ